MAAEEAPRPIIIVKKIKKVAGGHHGGAWKVAYADFVTAMMAFFLLLWLLNAVTEDQLEGIADYFSPVTISDSQSGAGGMLGGKTMAESGAMQNIKAQPSVSIDIPPPKFGSSDFEKGEAEFEPESKGGDEKSEAQAEAENQQREKEEQQFKEAEESLRQAIEGVPELKQLASSLLIDNTEEGLRIQIVDQEGLAMFPRGSAHMYPHTRSVLDLVAKVVKEMPQMLSISGFTDSTKFVGRKDYSNWELSADRANASRRVLIELGVPEGRISRVVGKAETDPLLPDTPEDPKNRRISLVLLRGTGQAPPAPPAPPEVKPEEKAEEKAEEKPAKKQENGNTTAG